jgi:hypothetical protein
MSLRKHHLSFASEDDYAPDTLMILWQYSLHGRYITSDDTQGGTCGHRDIDSYRGNGFHAGSTMNLIEGRVLNDKGRCRQQCVLCDTTGARIDAPRP